MAEDHVPAGHRLGFNVLGALELTIDGVAQPLGGTKPRAVLAMLLIRRGKAISVDVLADTVWEGHPPPDPRGAVHGVVSKLRKVLGAAGVDPRVVLATASAGYRLSVADDDYDLARFRALSAAGAKFAKSGRLDEVSAALSQALEQWKGPVLDDLRGYRFADDFADTLEEELLAAASARVQAEIACGRAESVVASLVALTNEHPLQEPLWVQLITALNLCGRQADALKACRRLRETLESEMGIEPSGPVQDLERRILHKDDTGGTETEIDLEPGSGKGAIRDSAGRAIPIPPNGLRIGRKEGNDVVPVGGNVSREHAVIIGAGTQFLIRDRSVNGTRVNGERIFDCAVLRDGDVIGIGKTEWTFEVVEV